MTWPVVAFAAVTWLGLAGLLALYVWSERRKTEPAPAELDPVSLVREVGEAVAEAIRATYPMAVPTGSETPGEVQERVQQQLAQFHEEWASPTDVMDWTDDLLPDEGNARFKVPDE